MRKPVVAHPETAAHNLAQWFRWALLATAAVLFALHFVHLRADFPDDSPWVDWAKYTDEGWYADAAIRHFLFGRWYLPGDFNPAVALPVWPLLLAVIFKITGVSLVAARATTVCVFGATLWVTYILLNQATRSLRREGQPSLAAPLAVLFLCGSPFFFAFDRLALLEPLLILLTLLALLTAFAMQPWSVRAASGASRKRQGILAIVLGTLLPGMVLTKTTAVALFPAVFCMLWFSAGRRLRPALSLAAIPVVVGTLLWSGYLLLFVRPHYLEDYRYLFSANAYTGFQLQPLATVLFNTFADGYWMGAVLYPTFYLGFAWFLLTRPDFFRSPLVSSLLFWIAGYFVFLAYHNNLQPRYYLVLALPVTLLVALMLDAICTQLAVKPRAFRWGRALVCAGVVLAIAVPDTASEIGFLRHARYTYLNAAAAIARIIRADPTHDERMLSVSGSDLTLMTGLPSIDDDFGTLDLDQRVRQYRPGWYVAWNQIDDDKMDALKPLYQPVRVATFPVMDDPDRNQLILYRLDPATTPAALRRHRLRTPRPLRTRLGQQPTTTQLQH